MKPHDLADEIELGIMGVGRSCYAHLAFKPEDWQQILALLRATPQQGEPLINDSFAADWLTSRAELHPLTTNLVVRFARALAAKLAEAEKKYGYGDGWASPGWMHECRAKLRNHIEKGDPRDVAAYCAFLWHHQESTTEHSAAQAPHARPSISPGSGESSNSSKSPECVASQGEREESVQPARAAVPAALPDGWVAVPKEPTPEMIRSGGYLYPERIGSWVEIYRAMLAAAPPAPGAQG